MASSETQTRRFDRSTHHYYQLSSDSATDSPKHSELKRLERSSVKMDMLLSQVELLTVNSIGTDTTTHNTPSLNVQLQKLGTQLLDANGAESSLGSQSPYIEPGLASSTESFYTAYSEVEENIPSSASTPSLLTFGGTLSAGVECDKFCQCQCHRTTQICTPWWAKQLFGSITLRCNGTVLLNRRACDNSYCRRSGSLRVHVSYMAPTWKFLNAFAYYVKSETLGGVAPSFNLFVLRVIPDDENIWGYIQHGNISRVREALSSREVSLYDVDSSGRSLLKVRSLLIMLPLFNDQLVRCRYGRTRYIRPPAFAICRPLWKRPAGNVSVKASLTLT